MNRGLDEKGEARLLTAEYGIGGIGGGAQLAAESVRREKKIVIGGKKDTYDHEKSIIGINYRCVTFHGTATGKSNQNKKQRKKKNGGGGRGGNLKKKVEWDWWWHVDGVENLWVNPGCLGRKYSHEPVADLI